MVERSKAEGLTTLLKELEATAPDIEASTVASADGLMIASTLPQDVKEDRVAAVSLMLSLREKAATELARGTLSEVYAKGKKVILWQKG